MIKFFQYPPLWDLPTGSPFCLKLETYLILAGIPYQSVYVKTPKGAPKGKLPYIEYKGSRVGDSGLIIDFLKREQGDRLDGSLKESQIWNGHALSSMVEEHLYWCMVYYRWVVQDNWQQLKKEIFQTAPLFVKDIVAYFVRRHICRQLYMQGTGRHLPHEIAAIGKKDILCLAQALGSKSYFLGTQPTSFDATMYGFLAHILFIPISSPLKQYAQTFDNLVQYCQRMRQQYFRR